MARAARLLICLLACCLAGCGERSADPQAVLFIVIDTLRADRLGCYGDSTAHTPHLDGLARRGTRFTDAMTVAPITQPSVTTLLTGQLPFRHGVRDNRGFVLDDEALTLAERLRKAGWRTGAILASAVLSADRGLDQGFEFYDDDFRGPYPVYQRSMRSLARGLGKSSRRGTDVTDRALAAIDDFGSDRYFLLVHYFDVHHPYDPPPDFARLHPGDPYDGEISYVDHEIGRLLAAVDEASTLVVVVSDHGEGLTDHDEGAHGFFLYQSTLAVPWIVAGPGVPLGLERGDLVSLTDIEPTLAAFLGLPPAPGRDGRTLQWARVEPEPVAQYAETFRTLVTYDWRELRALREGPYKLIQGGDRIELYDLDTDPRELREITGLPAADRMRETLRAMVEGDDPEQVYERARGVIESDRLEMLESLGYVSPSTEPRKPVRRAHPLDSVPRWNERQRYRHMLREATALVEDGEYRAGVETLDLVLDFDPENVSALYYRGLAREGLGRPEEGWDDLARAERLDPDYVPLQLEFAAREEEQGRQEEAWRRLERLLQSKPEETDVARWLGQSYLRSQEYERAVVVLRILLAHESHDVRARFALADALRESGEPEAARAEYEEILALHPEHPRADQIRQLLRDE